jgi:hypothetical protein
MGDYDVVGNFYGEFLKYTGGDKKGLGIVLTPKHITELFAELADIKKDSIVLDPCAGTGGFLISAMHKMLSYTNSKKEECNIKNAPNGNIPPNNPKPKSFMLFFIIFNFCIFLNAILTFTLYFLVCQCC